MNFTFNLDNYFNTNSKDNFSFLDSLYDIFNYSIDKLSEIIMNPIEEYIDEKLTIWWHVAIIIMIVEIVIGLFGNVLSLIVWNRGKESSTMACSTYFKILAASDILTILSYLIGFVIPHFLNITGTTYCEIMGRVHGFLVPFAPQLSAWVIVNISIERMLSLCFPFSFRKEGFRRRAWLASIVLAFVLLGLNHEQYICGSYVQGKEFGISMCTCTGSNSGLIGKLSLVWFLCILPLVVMTLCNIVISAKLYLIRKMRRRLSVPNRQSSQGAFNKMCISASFLHCLSVLPATILGYYFNDLLSGGTMDHLHDIYNFINLITTLFPLSIALFILNNSLNFLIYCFSGSKFRSDLKDLVLKCKCTFASGASRGKV